MKHRVTPYLACLQNHLLKTVWQALGTAAFWASWPLLHIYLRSSARTRVLVVAGDRVLVIKNWFGTKRWALPGGGLHRNEDPLLGSLRELKEETGLVLRPEQLRPLFADTYRQSGLRFNYRCYKAAVQTAVPLTPGPLEVITAAWLPKSQLTPANAGQDVIAALRHFNG